MILRDVKRLFSGASSGANCTICRNVYLTIWQYCLEVSDIDRSFHIALCEDDEGDMTQLRQCLEAGLSGRGLAATITEFADGEALMSAFRPGAFNIVVLDIFLGDANGMECAKQIRQMDSDCCIVFSTNSIDYTLEGYQVDASYYLLKPLTQAEVDNALSRCLRKQLETEPRTCSVLVDRKPVRIPVRDIQYVEVLDKYCHIHTVDGVVVSRTTISDMERQLPAPPFVRSHRCFLVNLHWVAGIDEDFVMEDGQRVLIRRASHRRIRDQYAHYLEHLAQG